MIDGFSEGGVYDAQFLGYGRRVRQEFTHPHATIVVFLLGKLVFGRADRKGFLARGHTRDALSVAHFLWQILAVLLAHLGLIIPQVEVRRATTHEKVNHPLCLGRKMGHARLPGEQIGETRFCE